MRAVYITCHQTFPLMVVSGCLSQILKEEIKPIETERECSLGRENNYGPQADQTTPTPYHHHSPECPKEQRRPVDPGLEESGKGGWDGVERKVKTRPGKESLQGQACGSYL